MEVKPALLPHRYVDEVECIGCLYCSQVLPNPSPNPNPNPNPGPNPNPNWMASADTARTHPDHSSSFEELPGSNARLPKELLKM